MQAHEQLNQRACCGGLITPFDIYKHPKLYDDQYWWKKDDIEFYKRIIPPGSSALEIGSGTGRLALPLLRAKIDYYGLELSEELSKYSQKKLRRYDSITRIFQGDMRSFNIKMKFDRIFIAFNSFLHILSDEDAMSSLLCIKDHLKENGEFILEILSPKPEFLYKENDSHTPVMDFKDSCTGELVEIFERCEYDNNSEICDLRWEYRYQADSEKSKVFAYQMRMYYPDTMNRLLIDAGFRIKELLGDYEGGRFNEHSLLQIYICK